MSLDATASGYGEVQPSCTPRISVILPCRNEEDHIESCVRSVLAQQPPAGGFEIIVADGLSTDRTRAILDRLARQDPRLRIISNPGRFVSSGLSAAIHASKGNVIARMDAHSVYADDYLRQCLAVLADTGADNVGGPALTLCHGYVQTAISAAFHSRFATGGARFHDPSYEGPVDTVPYGCWPRTVFSKIGLFDEELVRNQDDEFNLRLTRAGGTIWQSPLIKSWYRPRASLRDLFRQYRQYGYWKVRVIQKHRLPASLRHLVPPAFVLSLIVLAASAWRWPVARWALLALLGLYGLALLTASLSTVRAAGRRWTLLPILPLVFATYHASYGLGFLQGVLHFIVLRKGPAPSALALSRTSTTR